MRTLFMLATLVVMPAAAAAQFNVRPVAAPPGEESATCVPERRPCVFTDLQGDNVYTVESTRLRRTDRNQEMYSIPVAAGPVKVVGAGINTLRSQILIATEHASRSTGTMFTPGLISPDAIQRQYWLSIRNPKSGEEIKSIDLGTLRPLALASTATGDYIWVSGDELQLRKREVRAYNARSGKLEHSASLEKNATIRLFERGYQVAAAYYLAEPGAAGGVIRHNSPNAFSIAEFTVRRAKALSSAEITESVIGVIGFQSATPELREMLEGALSIKLAAAGFKVAERQRLKDILQEARFQNLGLTDSSKAAELGRLLNAQYLLFGQLSTTGTMTSLALRLVGVSDGAVTNGIELECRDCAPDDYLQGLTFLMQDWLH